MGAVDINLAVAIVGGLALIIAGYGGGRVGNRTATYQRMAALETRVDSLERDREADRDYIGVLKGHIWAGLPPPPPPRPHQQRSDVENKT